MKKFIIPVLALAVFACSQNPSTKVSSSVTSNVVSQGVTQVKSGADIRFTFDLKALSVSSRVVSVDVYLVTPANLNDPTNSAKYLAKQQVNVVNGTVTTTFTGMPVGGPYFAVLQAFDSGVPASPPPSVVPARNNISSVAPSPYTYNGSISTNSATVASGAVVTYSDGGNALNFVVALAPYNNSNANVTILPGSPPPSVTVKESSAPY